MKKISASKTAVSLYITLCMAGTLISCEKHISIDAPTDQTITATVFKDSASAQAAVTGMYSQQNMFAPNFYYGTLSGYVTLLPALCADELTPTGFSAFQEFASNNITVTNTDNTTNWSNAYNIVYHANAIIENLQQSTSLSTGLKQRLTGEAKFMRALNLFYLTSEYGAIPVPLQSDYTVNSSLTRMDTAVVLDQIIADLKEAQATMLPSYTIAPKLRANKHAATALLAKVYLMRGYYADAEKQATTVITEGDYTMAPANGTFAAGSTETILQFASAVPGSWNTPDAGTFLLSVPYKLTDQLLNSFEANDLRKTLWTTSFTMAGTTVSVPYKYKIPYSTAGAEYNVVLRLAEMFLIRAEARVHNNNTDGAISDIDMIRKRAQLPLIRDTRPNILPADLLTAIAHENQVEFFVEWGHRWFDLKRTGKAHAVLSVIKGDNWKATDILFPIPQSERRLNTKLDQNLGYL